MRDLTTFPWGPLLTTLSSLTFTLAFLRIWGIKVSKTLGYTKMVSYSRARYCLRRKHDKSTY